ncbi:MAG: ABC transporter permease [Lactobacillales bacterium]|nr:ABC transporter permease [Lactobacillales bacterium]
MREFYKKRSSKHLTRMMKYMRYVFNDHFVLVCLFLLGGVGFYYSQLVKTLPENFFWGKVAALLVFIGMIQVGKLATLSENADMVFLLPKEKQMLDYLKGAFYHSLLLPFVACFLIAGFLMPLIVVSTGNSFTSFFAYVLLLFIFKWIDLELKLQRIYQNNEAFVKKYFTINLVVAFILFALSLWVTPFVVVLGAIWWMVLGRVLNHRLNQEPLDWEKMVATERARMHRIYQFIALFTDVPEITSSVKRRKWLDGLLKKIQTTSKNTYFYLFSRGFLRGTEYSGLVIRLVVVGGLVLFFLKENWIAAGVALLFTYLIGFQLIPMYTQFDYMVMTRLYPVQSGNKRASVQKLVGMILIVVAIIFGIITLITLSDKIFGLFVVVGLFVEAFLFNRFYLPNRLKKMEK